MKLIYIRGGDILMKTDKELLELINILSEDDRKLVEEIINRLIAYWNSCKSCKHTKVCFGSKYNSRYGNYKINKER